MVSRLIVINSSWKFSEKIVEFFFPEMESMCAIRFHIRILNKIGKFCLQWAFNTKLPSYLVFEQLFIDVNVIYVFMDGCFYLFNFMDYLSTRQNKRYFVFIMMLTIFAKCWSVVYNACWPCCIVMFR